MRSETHGVRGAPTPTDHQVLSDRRIEQLDVVQCPSVRHRGFFGTVRPTGKIYPRFLITAAKGPPLASKVRPETQLGTVMAGH